MSANACFIWSKSLSATLMLALARACNQVFAK